MWFILLSYPNAHACEAPLPLPDPCPELHRVALVSQGRLPPGADPTETIAQGEPLLFHVSEAAAPGWSSTIDARTPTGQPVAFTIAERPGMAQLWLHAEPGDTVHLTFVDGIHASMSDTLRIFTVVEPPPPDDEAPVAPAPPAPREIDDPCGTTRPALWIPTSEDDTLALVRAPATGWSGIVQRDRLPVPSPEVELLLQRGEACAGITPLESLSYEITLIDPAGNIGETVAVGPFALPEPPGVAPARGCAHGPRPLGLLALLPLAALRRRRR